MNKKNLAKHDRTYAKQSPAKTPKDIENLNDSPQSFGKVDCLVHAFAGIKLIPCRPFVEESMQEEPDLIHMILPPQHLFDLEDYNAATREDRLQAWRDDSQLTQERERSELMANLAASDTDHSALGSTMAGSKQKDSDVSSQDLQRVAPASILSRAIGFQCALCPRDFDTPRDLKLHTKKRHERPTNRVIVKMDEYYPCHIC